ncbi:hypothetical protein [Shewanella woodyi]|uniref:Uncharacterized protein n=1 Tax=Shewanella woodyi (strain ATCC 51908 / MS32) TaxID=392500 RepID=B1KLR6_SHEWM|nr:hypothetical protein [Shewanella woodyi]ACA87363.1 hypothetical protein Swoo_3092 [Shewanella woodyi ATCC 51908]
MPVTGTEPELTKVAIETVQAVCSWKPEHYVEIIKEIAWPVVVLVISLRYKALIVTRVKALFENLQLGKLTLGTSGLSTEWQSNDKQKPPLTNNKIEGDLKSLSQIKLYQEQNDSEYIQDAILFVEKQLDYLNVPLEEQIKLLSAEYSILAATNRYVMINNAIYKSQYNLLVNLSLSTEAVTYQNLEIFFNALKADNPEHYEKTDTQLYLRFLIDWNLIKVENSLYSLTLFGFSYIKYMKKNENITHSFRNV